jgi:hypothetical protein
MFNTLKDDTMRNELFENILNKLIKEDNGINIINTNTQSNSQNNKNN